MGVAVFLAFTAVHPHGRGDGENRHAAGRKSGRFTPTGVGTARHRSGERAFYLGSPPRAWGRRETFASVSQASGFTPTGVGTAQHISPPLPERMRFTPTGVGTAICSTASQISRAGSPPRAWGRLTRSRAPHLHLLGSPPRAWGRRQTIADNDDEKTGSPPRAWGRRFGTLVADVWTSVHPHGRGDGQRREARAEIRHRFTPTGVGTANGSTAHSPLLCGSPPRAWGRLDAAHLRGFRQRFTPTGVGTARVPNPPPEINGVHPHGRGDGDGGYMAFWNIGRFTPTGVGTAP